MFSLICAWINGWVNNREAGDLRRKCAHYDVIVMKYENSENHSSSFGSKLIWNPNNGATLSSNHYIDVIMTTMASQITSLTVVYSTVYLYADQRKHQRSASLAFVWGIHRDRWIPRTKGQLRGKCFHLMTSSCTVHKSDMHSPRSLSSHWSGANGSNDQEQSAMANSSSTIPISATHTLTVKWYLSLSVLDGWKVF